MRTAFHTSASVAAIATEVMNPHMTTMPINAHINFRRVFLTINAPTISSCYFP